MVQFDPQNTNDAQPAPDVAYFWIRQHIVNLPREADAFLNEVALAEATKTSRTPVREALLRLEGEGLLRRIPRKGAYVPSISDTEVRALLDARSLVECWAVEAAGDAIRAEADTFQKLIDDQRSAQTHTPEFIELDTEFHGLMVKLARNPLVEEFYSSLRLRQLRIGVRAVTHDASRGKEVLREHQAILDAIVNGDDACAAIRAHLASTLAAVISR